MTYDNENFRSLPEPHKLAVVFHSEAVKLISYVRKGGNDSDKAAINEFTGTVRQMKQEVAENCLYVAKALGIAPVTILTEVDHAKGVAVS
jgi:hypothetical protein